MMALATITRHFEMKINLKLKAMKSLKHHLNRFNPTSHFTCVIVAAVLSGAFLLSPLHANEPAKKEAAEATTPTQQDTGGETQPTYREGSELLDYSIITATTNEDEATKPVIEELQADWRDGFGDLSIGYLIAGDERLQRRKLESFRLALEAASQLTVKFRAVRTLNDLIKLQADRRIQYAMHSASSYVTLQAFCKCVEPIAVPTDQAGASGVHAVIIAPFSGKVRSLSDLKGNRLAVPAPPATLTRLLPLYYFKDIGYDEPDDLGEVIDVVNPVEGWRKITAGEADAAIGWSSLKGEIDTGYSSGTLNHLIGVTEIAKSTDMRVVWQSKKVPNAPHVIRADTPTPLKELLREFLTNLHEKNRAAYDAVAPTLSGGFTLIKDADFAPLAKIIEEKKDG